MPLGGSSLLGFDTFTMVHESSNLKVKAAPRFLIRYVGRSCMRGPLSGLSGLSVRLTLSARLSSTVVT